MFEWWGFEKPPEEGGFFVDLMYGLENFFADHAANTGDICIGDKFKFGQAHAGEPELQLAVQINHAGSFNRERLDLAIRKTGKVLFLTSDALDGKKHCLKKAVKIVVG